MNSFIDISGKQFGDWEALKYIGNKYWECKCSCGKIKNIRKYELTHNKNNKCTHINDLINTKINEWTILEIVDSKYIKCKCSCGNVKTVYKQSILNGTSKSCGHNTTGFKDLKGKRFGEWEVIEYAENSKWKCMCSCGIISIVRAGDLISNKSKSCGHNTNIFKDLTKQKFNEWLVIEYIGDSKWLCKCSCNKLGVISSYDLRNNKSKSCGCKSVEKALETKLKTYGDIDSHKFKNNRQEWQINTLQDKEQLCMFIRSNKNKTPIYLANKLGITVSTFLKKIRSYDMYNEIDIYKFSEKEKELVEFIKSLNNNIILHDRKILNGKELDIYIPEKKIAIEFNGNYWHSDVFKNKKYHQDKTIDCAKKHIQLIHIFEYEWENNKDNIKQYLKNRLTDKIKVYARSTEVKLIEKEKANIFLDKYHLQNSCNAEINIALVKDNEIQSVLTIGKPRFNNNYQYEIIRYCTKDDIIIIGGIEKLFRFFMDNYNPTSIITYSDISKFTGNCYLKLGFKVIDITDPNYMWVNTNTNEVLTRYKTQKHKLIDKYSINENQTEDEIMKSMNYLKVYGCGNIRLEWIKHNY